jgi:hypothetical protein
LFDLAAEGVEILKLVVYRSEANVGHFVEFAQFRHHPLPEERGRKFALGVTRQANEEPSDEGLDRLRGDRTLLQRAIDAGAQFLLGERFATAVALDDLEGTCLDSLAGVETLPALFAGATAANDPALGGFPRLDHPGLAAAAVWATHRRV